MLAQNPRFTCEEYLEWESRQELKHEYIDGEVFAMSGASIPHNDIVVNLTAALKTHLRGRSCKLLLSDVKVRVADNGPFFYPDLAVTCDPRDLKATQYVEHPSLIIEVLSDSTEAFDRGDKFRAYRRINELQEYLLISQKSKFVDLFYLSSSGIWQLHSLSQPDDFLHLGSINFEISVADLYEDVNI